MPIRFVYTKGDEKIMLTHRKGNIALHPDHADKLVELCDLYKVDTPTVLTAPRKKRGAYYPRKMVINMGRDNMYVSLEHFKYVLCHEMAHHIDWETSVRDEECLLNHRSAAVAEFCKRKKYDRIGRKSHDRKFYSILLTCIDFFYAGDRADYPWKNEYKMLKRWAAGDGYYVPVARASVVASLVKHWPRAAAENTKIMTQAEFDHLFGTTTEAAFWAKREAGQS